MKVPAFPSYHEPAREYVILEISADAYEEVRAKLDEAGYQDSFQPRGEIDMRGIALTSSALPSFEILADR
jgi:hypothetical protein